MSIAVWTALNLAASIFIREQAVQKPGMAGNQVQGSGRKTERALWQTGLLLLYGHILQGFSIPYGHFRERLRGT